MCLNPKSVKKCVFLCFWDLVENNLRLKCWWNWHHFSPHNSFFQSLFLSLRLLSICLSLSFNAKYSFLLYPPHSTTLCLWLQICLFSNSCHTIPLFFISFSLLQEAILWKKFSLKNSKLVLNYLTVHYIILGQLTSI